MFRSYAPTSIAFGRFAPSLCCSSSSSSSSDLSLRALCVFRWSSQTGCAANEHDENSDGARECLTICAAFDLPTEPIRRKCGF